MALIHKIDSGYVLELDKISNSSNITNARKFSITSDQSLPIKGKIGIVMFDNTYGRTCNCYMILDGWRHTFESITTSDGNAGIVASRKSYSGGIIATKVISDRSVRQLAANMLNLKNNKTCIATILPAILEQLDMIKIM